MQISLKLNKCSQRILIETTSGSWRQFANVSTAIWVEYTAVQTVVHSWSTRLAPVNIPWLLHKHQAINYVQLMWITDHFKQALELHIEFSLFSASQFNKGKTFLKYLWISHRQQNIWHALWNWSQVFHMFRL